MAASIKMAFIAIVSVLFQFGLAILGGGGFSIFFSHTALVALAIATVALTVVALLPAQMSVPAKRRIGRTAGCSQPSA